MPNPGQPFIDGDDVTASRLNALVREQSFVSGEVPGAALADLAVSRAKIANNAVDNAKVEKNTLNADRLIAAEEISGSRVGQVLVSQSNGDFASKALSGDIKVDAGGVAEIQPQKVSAAKLADNAVESRVIKAGSVLTQHLKTLVLDTSGSAGNYACTVENVELFQGLEIKLFVPRGNTATPTGGVQGQVTLSLNNGPPKPVLKPGGLQFAYGEIAGGAIISMIWTGSHWLVLSPWTPLSRLTEERTTGTYTIPANATRLRIRCWASGGAAIAYEIPGFRGNPDSWGAYNGGGGAFAEWEGLLAAGSFSGGQTLTISNSQTHMTVAEQAPPARMLLRCEHGKPGSTTVPAGPGAGGSFDHTSALASLGVRFAHGTAATMTARGEGSDGRGFGGQAVFGTRVSDPPTLVSPSPALCIFDATVPAET